MNEDDLTRARRLRRETATRVASAPKSLLERGVSLAAAQPLSSRATADDEVYLADAERQDTALLAFYNNFEFVRGLVEAQGWSDLKGEAQGRLVVFTVNLLDGAAGFIENELLITGPTEKLTELDSLIAGAQGWLDDLESEA